MYQNMKSLTLLSKLEQDESLEVGSCINLKRCAMSELSDKTRLQSQADANFLRKLLAGLLVATAVCGAGIAGTIPRGEETYTVVAEAD